MEVDPLALGRAVRARRLELDLGQADVVQRSGLSLSTISAIERGLAHKLRPTSLIALDKALEWSDGTAALLYSGLGSVREAIRDLGGKPPTGSRYRELLLALAKMSDEDIERIVVESKLRDDPYEHHQHSA